MNSIRHSIKLALVTVAAFACSTAFAQATAPASPEPGDAPVAEKVEVTPTAPVEAIAPEPPVAGSSSAVAAPSAKRIEQRVDGASTEEIIRVTPKAKKNVYRIDNKPNRPKVTPIAVIKGPVAPWGYAGRYINGEVDRPAAKDLRTTQQGPGGRPGQPGLQPAGQSSRGLGGLGANRERGGRRGGRED